MDNIEKIEVIKGPGASAYGADATGGVINIITKKGTQNLMKHWIIPWDRGKDIITVCL